jgi:N-hydroxyarylamine O-acetyltransferase
VTQVSAAGGPAVSQQWADRYLAFLGVPREAPSFAALSRLTRAHLRAVVFENITSLLRRRTHGTPVPAVEPEAVLSNWEAGRSGGVCFEAGFMYSRLLPALGYDARLVLDWKGRFDGRHQAVVVELNGGRFLLDVGNGSPHFEPIPLDGLVEVHHAGLAYRFRPGEAPDEWIQDRWIDEAWAPFFTYNLRPADEQVRQAAYQRHHVPGESFVVSSLTLVRCEEHQILQLRNHEFTRHTDDGKEKVQLTEPEEYARIVAEEFRLPAMPIVDGVAAWQELARDLPEPWTPRPGA